MGAFDSKIQSLSKRFADAVYLITKLKKKVFLLLLRNCFAKVIIEPMSPRKQIGDLS